MKALVQDLKYAQTTSVCVEVVMLNGEKLLTGVHDVNEDEGFVSLHNPQTMSDLTTTRKVTLDFIGSWTVTDVRFGPRNG